MQRLSTESQKRTGQPNANQSAPRISPPTYLDVGRGGSPLTSNNRRGAVEVFEDERGGLGLNNSGVGDAVELRGTRRHLHHAAIGVVHSSQRLEVAGLVDNAVRVDDALVDVVEVQRPQSATGILGTSSLVGGQVVVEEPVRDDAEFDLGVVQLELVEPEAERPLVATLIELVHQPEHVSAVLRLEVVNHARNDLVGEEAVGEQLDDVALDAHSLAIALQLVERVEQDLEVELLALEVGNSLTLSELLVDTGGVGTTANATSLSRNVQGRAGGGVDLRQARVGGQRLARVQRLVEEEVVRVPTLEVLDDLPVDLNLLDIAELLEERIAVTEGSKVLLSQLILADRIPSGLDPERNELVGVEGRDLTTERLEIRDVRSAAHSETEDRAAVGTGLCGKITRELSLGLDRVRIAGFKEVRSSILGSQHNRDIGTIVVSSGAANADDRVGQAVDGVTGGRSATRLVDGRTGISRGATSDEHAHASREPASVGRDGSLAVEPNRDVRALVRGSTGASRNADGPVLGVHRALAAHLDEGRDLPHAASDLLNAKSLTTEHTLLRLQKVVHAVLAHAHSLADEISRDEVAQDLVCRIRVTVDGAQVIRCQRNGRARSNCAARFHVGSGRRKAAREDVCRCSSHSFLPFGDESYRVTSDL